MRTAAVNARAVAGLSLLVLSACGPGGEPASGAPPDGALAFNTVRDGNYEVYVMPAGGGMARNVTSDTGVDWVYGSRDGRLAVVSTRDGRWPRPDYDLYSLDPVTGSLDRITGDFPVYDSWLGFQPDGNLLAVCSRKDGDSEVYVINRDGVERAKLTDNDARDCDPDWSPDGRWIVFRSDRDGAWEIWKMTADGSDPVQLTDLAANDSIAQGYQEGPPRWSPDGEWIVWPSQRDGTDTEIVVMRADGSDIRQLTANDAADGWPDWSPDGQWIAFHSDRTGDYEIWVMRADGSDPRRLTRTPGTDLAPVWIR